MNDPNCDCGACCTQCGHSPDCNTRQPQPCGESGCLCYGTGPDHVDCACGCDCPRDDYGQLIHEG